MPIPSFLTALIENLIFRQVIITRISAPSAHLRLVEVTGEVFKGATWLPGQIVQFRIGTLLKRAYTPMTWDSITGRAHFLIYLNGNGPGSQWAASLREGDSCGVMRPQKAIDLGAIDDPVIFFGDETAIGTAKALEDMAGRRGRNSYIFEVSSVSGVESALRLLNMPSTYLVSKVPSMAHLEEVAQAIMAYSRLSPTPFLVFAGQAKSIQSVRRLLLDQGFSGSRMKTKPYWAPGKSGLD